MKILNTLLLICLVNSEPTLLFELGTAQTEIKTKNLDTNVYVETQVLRGGKQEGVFLINITTPNQTLLVSPSRGMNIVDWLYGFSRSSAGWSSPVTEVVNPIYINQLQREGSGFLEGFNEVVARCGFEFVGHAGWDGDEYLTLHGMNAATPASQIMVDYVNEAVVITANIHQKAFKKVNFDIVSKLTVPKNGNTFIIEDTLTNAGPYDREFMVLYHSNFGGQLLGEGSKIYVPAEEVHPFNQETIDIAAHFNEAWDDISQPTRDYDETVYNIYPKADADNNTLALLVNSEGDSAVKVGWNVEQMPVFGLWKNLDLPSQGYVVGLEPGTSFSYNRLFNRDLDLVPMIKSGESKTFKLEFEIITNAQEVTIATNNVKKIQADTQPVIAKKPLHNELIQGESSSAFPTIGSILAAAVLIIFAV